MFGRGESGGGSRGGIFSRTLRGRCLGFFFNMLLVFSFSFMSKLSVRKQNTR